METAFLQYFKRFKFLSLEDLRLLYGIVRIKRVDAGEVIIQEGEKFYYSIVVFNGLLRNYIITTKGDDRTLYFASERMQTTSPDTIFLDQPSVETIQAIEPSLLLFLDTRKFKQLAKNRPSLLRIQTKNMEKALMNAIERLRFLTVLSPEERYVQFRDEHPGLIQRVPQKYLASFLGVTTVSLSRIKARVAKYGN